jgi:hypothetical protein
MAVAIILFVSSSTNPMMRIQLRMLPPGATLPSETQCASRIAASSREPRPDNFAANHTVPTAQQIARLSAWDENAGADPRADTLRRQITGNYSGTTDQILQWVACKWGIDPDILRAEATKESDWHQSMRGDYTSDMTLCPPGTWDGSGCYQSYGILQVKYESWQGVWPINRTSTAFNAEWAYGWIRACYEGWIDYLYQHQPLAGYPSYHAGDIWGCVGFWYSGNWYDRGAVSYINKVKLIYNSRDWPHTGL